MNRSIRNFLLFIIVILTLAFGYLVKSFYFPSSETLLNRYLTNKAKSSSFASIEKYSSATSKIESRGKADISKKSLIAIINVQCLQDGMNIDVDQQAENAEMYVRFNTVAGVPANSQGFLNIEALNTSLKSQWIPLFENTSLKDQLDNKVYITTDGITAPSHNPKEIAKSLKKHEVFKIVSSKKEGDLYYLKVIANKQNYLMALKEAVPGLKESKEILNDNFGDSNKEAELTLVLDRMGNLQEIHDNEDDLCGSIIELLTGKTSTSKNNLKGSSKIVEPKEILIERVKF